MDIVTLVLSRKYANKKTEECYDYIDNEIKKSYSFSTEERFCGYWLNDKPIYKKTFELTDPEIFQKGVNFEVSVLPENFDMLVKGYGLIKTYENSYSNNNIIVYSATNGIMAKQDFTGYPEKMWITIEYTKTTD